jgi:hypothetical protein
MAGMADQRAARRQCRAATGKINANSSAKTQKKKNNS